MVNSRDSQYERLSVFPTVDSGVRLSDAQLWDESSRPTRSASPADVTYTRVGRAVGSHLIAVHDHLRSELDNIRDLVESVESGAVSASEAVALFDEFSIRQNNWTIGAYCAAYCRMVALHHGLEDADIFPHLRSCETDLEPVIDRLSEEHTIIHDVLENLKRALVELVANPQDERWTSLPTRSSHIFRMRNTNWSNRSRVMSSTTARFVEGMSPPTRSGSAR
ncbi:MAG: hemerythrin domain-containing protein [Acidimicrobiales bacterium]|jgi:hemerythrin-like domain-containing protein